MELKWGPDEAEIESSLDRIVCSNGLCDQIADPLPGIEGAYTGPLHSDVR